MADLGRVCTLYRLGSGGSIYSVSLKRSRAPILRYNFGICWPILKILSLLDSARNLQQNSCYISHRTPKRVAVPCETWIFKFCNCFGKVLWRSSVLSMHGLGQNIIDDALIDCRKRLRACIRAKGGHLEHLLWLKVRCDNFCVLRTFVNIKRKLLLLC